jgi:hypothetical protein
MQTFSSNNRIRGERRTSRGVAYFCSAALLAVLPFSPARDVVAQTSAPAQSPRPSSAARPATPNPAMPNSATQTARATTFDLGEYGVQITADPRLFAVMGALDAAGFEAVAPEGTATPAFLAEIRRVNSSLDQTTRTRLRDFYVRNRLPAPANSAQQAARYISLAFALGAAPALDPPARTDDLPDGVLDVLDFAPLVRDYYAKANLGELQTNYLKASQTIGNSLRPGIAGMLTTVLNRFRVRPTLTTNERVAAPAPLAKNKKQKGVTYINRERARRFQIVADPFAVPGSINLRVVADDFYVVLPAGANPASPELRRAYIQFLVEPLIGKFSREIALRRTDINGLQPPATATPTAATTITTITSSSSAAMQSTPSAPGIFEAVTRSLVAAVDARITESLRTERLQRELAGAKSEADKLKLAGARREITDARTATLADAFERGGVLAFYFAEQLDGIEASGFDATNLIPDIINSFNPARERLRLAEAKEARARWRSVEQRRTESRAAEIAAAEQNAEEMEMENPRAAQLVRNLEQVQILLRANNYSEAEDRLRALLSENGGDPRILFALGQAASLSAQDATDEAVQGERLNRALANYRLSIQAALPESDKALLSRAHTAIGAYTLSAINPMKPRAVSRRQSKSAKSPAAHTAKPKPRSPACVNLKLVSRAARAFSRRSFANRNEQI